MKTKPEVWCYLGAAAVIAAGLVTGHSVCIWRAITGFQCPGCGMTHAMLALARGDWRAAWRLNHNSLAVAPMLLWTLEQEMMKWIRRPQVQALVCRARTRTS